MTKRFVIAVDNCSEVDLDSLTVFLESQGFHIWHWFSNLWLIADDTGTVKLRDLRKEIDRQLPSGSYLMFDMLGTNDWLARGTPDMADWLNKHWL